MHRFKIFQQTHPIQAANDEWRANFIEVGQRDAESGAALITELKNEAPFRGAFGSMRHPVVEEIQ